MTTPNYLHRVFSLDLRSLALLRMGLGWMLLITALDLWGNAGTFLSDAGTLPRAARMQLNLQEEFTEPPYYVSLHMLSGEVWYQRTLLTLAAASGVGVMVGWRTTACLFVSWVLLIGQQGRNPLILQGGDDILRCLTFWCLFLPLGAKWSLDARRSPTAAGTHICSLASAALVIQLACIYVFTALLKHHPMWFPQFEALHYALHSDQFTTPLGYELLRWPGLVKALTAGTLLLELGGPIVLLLPWQDWRIRTAIVTSFWMLHLGIQATMEIGLFPATCLVYWVALLPSEIWQGNRSTPTYEMSADRPNVVVNSLLGVLLLYVLLLNVVRLEYGIFSHLGAGPLRVLGDAAQLNQFWGMFAPRPYDFGGWVRIDGVLTDGRRVNLMQPDLPPQETRPAYVAGTFANWRWRKCLLNMVERDCPTHRAAVSDYFRRQWNAAHSHQEQLASLELRLMKQPTLPPGEQGPRGDAAEAMMLYCGR
jgi:hypothetical protein